VVAAEAALGVDRGGEGIPSLRASRVRLATALAATAIASGLAVYPLLEAGRVTALVDVLAGVGTLCVLFSLTGLAWFVPAGLLALGTELVVADLFGRVEPAAVLLYAPGLLVLAELVYWSRSLTGPAIVQPAVVATRSAQLVACAVGAALAAFLALLGGSVHLSVALATGVVGVGASVALIGLVSALAGRLRSGAS
jgi:hypothetical protein